MHYYRTAADFGDSVPSTREPGGGRSFVSAANGEIWLKQGDAAVYSSEPPSR